MSVRATVVVPTHDHHLTLPMAVASALAQTVADLEVIVLGDGVTDAVRATATRLADEDARVRFLDLPKGEHHGEVYRDRAVREARSEAIFYLCDDDLLLPRHVENLLGLLDDHDLVQCRNGYVRVDGGLVLFPTDLAVPESVSWHLREPRRNCISLTGTAHRRDSYLALDEGWTTTPAGEWPDHYMWKKLLRQPGVRAATHPDMTAVQLPTSAGREDEDQDTRADELSAWVRKLERPDAHEWLQQLVATTTPVQLDTVHRANINARIEVEAFRDQRTVTLGHLDRTNHALALHRAEVDRLRAEVVRLNEEADRLTTRNAELREKVREAVAARKRWQRKYRAVTGSASWRATAPLRSLRRKLTRT